MNISVTNLRNGYFEYSTIYKGRFCYKLYDTDNKRKNKKDFENFCFIYTNF